MDSNKILPKICSKFYCEICDYGTCKKSSYDDHLVSAKHTKSMVGNEILPKFCSEFVCPNCSKKYIEAALLSCVGCIVYTQKTVLEEINKLRLTRTATKIAEVFSDLKESSEHLGTFQVYQKSLNSYVDKTEKVATEMNTIIEGFKDFNTNLKVISNNTIATIELQKQFKDSLEKHFPTINDHREIWRNQVDELNEDIKSVYVELNTYFRTSTEQIQSFIGSNNNFFTGINEIQNAIQIFVQNSSIQKDEFNILKNQIVDMRNDFKDSQKQTIETNKALIDAIIDLKKTISKIEITTEK
jgi:ABC-type transporter Mla subunit MlaD